MAFVAVKIYCRMPLMPSLGITYKSNQNHCLFWLHLSRAAIARCLRGAVASPFIQYVICVCRNESQNGGGSSSGSCNRNINRGIYGTAGSKKGIKALK